MAIITESNLQEMVNVIVQALDPKQIVLFGSYARGTAKPESDVDILIVQDRPFDAENSRRRQMVKISRLLAHEPSSHDILIFSPQEIDHWRGTKNHVIARAFREGRVLYERS